MGAKVTERMEYSLSSAFEPGKVEPCLECRATVININMGQNHKLMSRCHKLYEYAAFVQLVKDNERNGMPLDHAIRQAVDQAITQGVLKTFLTKNRAEVIEMVLTEYNEQRHIENEKRIAEEEAEARGEVRGEIRGDVKRLIQLIQKKYCKGKDLSVVMEELEEDSDEIRTLYKLVSEHRDLSSEEIYQMYAKS